MKKLFGKHYSVIFLVFKKVVLYLIKIQHFNGFNSI